MLGVLLRMNIIFNNIRSASWLRHAWLTEASSRARLLLWAAHACPASAEEVPVVCMKCPASPMNAAVTCTENIFGGTRRYASSCGGQSVEVHFEFDSTIWNFDAGGPPGTSWLSELLGCR